MSLQKRILVTGGAGYIGSHTVKELIRSGYTDITVVDDLSFGDKTRIPDGVKFIEADFSDAPVLTSEFEKGIETVIHLAALKSAPESVDQPTRYYECNVSKSIGLLNLCLKYGVNNFIFSSSAAVYGDIKASPITEEFSILPTNPYGWSKAMFERVLDDASLTGTIKVVSLRYFNVGGADPDGTIGNDHEQGDDLISILQQAASTGDDFTIFGTNYGTKDGSCIRDIVHVTDIASAHVDALKYLQEGNESVTLNLGSEQGFSIREIVDITKNVTGSSFRVIEGDRRVGDIVTSIASSQKAHDIIGWNRRYSDIETIIKTAWKWHNQVDRKADTSKSDN